MRCLQKFYRNSLIAVKPPWNSPTSKNRGRRDGCLLCVANWRAVAVGILLKVLFAAGGAHAEEVAGRAAIVNAGLLR